MVSAKIRYGSRNIVRDKVVNCKEYYDFSKYPKTFKEIR